MPFSGHSFTSVERTAILDIERRGTPFLVYRDAAGDVRFTELGDRDRISIGRIAGNDVLLGGAQNDTYIGGTSFGPPRSRVKFVGDSGIDMADYSNSTGRVLVDIAFTSTPDSDDGRPGSEGSLEGDQDDITASVEHLKGSPFDDSLRGSTV